MGCSNALHRLAGLAAWTLNRKSFTIKKSKNYIYLSSLSNGKFDEKLWIKLGAKSYVFGLLKSDQFIINTSITNSELKQNILALA
jgi:hypothetical protein